jgi:hypothetical protein
MKPMTREWVAKAEGDFAMVEREARARKNCKIFRRAARKALGLRA